MQTSDGSFYGTSSTGGSSGDGTVFKLQLTYETLTVSTSGNGAVTSTDGNIDCPGTCSYSYQNAQVTLNATPASGWAFSSWGGACSGSDLPATSPSRQNTSVRATFYQLPVTLTVSVAGSGTVTSTDGHINCPGTCTHTYDPNSPVTLNAAAASGWIFAGWTGACTGVGACNLTMTANLSVTAVFIQPGHGLTFSSATPCRLVDTRKTGRPIAGGSSQNYRAAAVARLQHSLLRRRLLAERDRSAAGTVGLHHHLADRRSPAHDFHHELAGWPHQGQRGDCARRNQ